MFFHDANTDTQALEVRRKSRKAAAAYLAVVFVVSAFLWGFYLGSGRSKAQTVNGSATSTVPVDLINVDSNKSVKKLDFNEFWDLWQTVRERYVRQPVDEQKMFYGAMAGVVASLDDAHSVFFDPPSSAEFQQELSGKFEGIGAELGFKKNLLVIVAPLPGSPAEKAGLKTGDIIIGIDKLDTGGMGLDEAVSHIRGDKGTIVKLTIVRGTEQKPRIFDIVRDTIIIQSVRLSFVKSPMGKSIALLKVTNFNGDTAEKFAEAVSAIARQKPDGVIFDLRGNPGGFLDAAVSMLGEWIPGEIGVSERYADGSKENHRIVGRGLLSNIKTVVLVNGGSASASEIMSGALKDLRKGTLIGTQTFGKGSVQDLLPFKDGATVKLTIAEWLTPNGTHIDQNGIAPDYVVDRTDEDYSNDRDPQLDAAKNIFDGKTPPQTHASATSTKE